MGIPVASFIDGECLNLSPLRNKKRTVKFFYLEEELRDILIDPGINANSSKKFSKFFYTNQKLPKWKKLLLSNFDKSIDEV